MKVHEAFVRCTIVRSSVLFGKETDVTKIFHEKVNDASESIMVTLYFQIMIICHLQELEIVEQVLFWGLPDCGGGDGHICLTNEATL